MSVAMKESNYYLDGVSKKQFETSLIHLQEQLRRMDQKIITKIDKEISLHYENQKHKLIQTGI